MAKKKILYLTDLYYAAKGRNYYEEDMFIVSQLMDDFDVAICHPKNAEAFEDDVDMIVFRNTGAVMGYKDIYDAFVRRVKEKHLNTFNEFTGKGDMAGKQYLIDLTKAGFPVIPTIDDMKDFALLPACEKYAVKPKLGADSIGLKFLSREELFSQFMSRGDKAKQEACTGEMLTDPVVNFSCDGKRNGKNPRGGEMLIEPAGNFGCEGNQLGKNPHGRKMLIEPAVDFQYEVSFYFIDDHFEYAMYAPDKTKRWELVAYEATADDLSFARKFIEWNDIRHGIQRVDACRTQDGCLLLVELEDLNPFLSLQLTSEETQKKFIADLKAALAKTMG